MDAEASYIKVMRMRARQTNCASGFVLPLSHFHPLRPQEIGITTFP